MDQILACELCSAASYLKFHISDYIKHLKIYQPNFKVTCRIAGCQRKYTNLGTLQNHICGVHSENFMDVLTEYFGE